MCLQYLIYNFFNSHCSHYVCDIFIIAAQYFEMYVKNVQGNIHCTYCVTIQNNYIFQLNIIFRYVLISISNAICSDFIIINMCSDDKI